jgi:hypothetical protein
MATQPTETSASKKGRAEAEVDSPMPAAEPATPTTKRRGRQAAPAAAPPPACEPARRTRRTSTPGEGQRSQPRP